MAFNGFPPEALDFYRRLERDNTKVFWTANKAIYEQSVKRPMLALLEAMPSDLQPFRVFRPNRDVRFSKDKSPYKTNIAAMTEHEHGSLFYVALSAEGLMAGVGYYHMAPDQLTRFRDAVADESTGASIASLVAKATRKGFQAGAIDELKTAPRGYAKDHPRIDLLRRKGLVVFKEFGVAPWLHTSAVKGKLVAAFADARPVAEWLDAHVGPSEMAPDDGWG